MSEKIDFKKSLERYRSKAGEFRVLQVPAAQYLMIEGAGDPNTSDSYQQALQTLYPLAYKLKFASKAQGRDYVVPPLEGLWWAEDMAVFTERRDKAKWRWTMMLMVPAWINEDDYATALETAQAKKPLPCPGRIRFETLAEGQCVQTLHIGPYDAEAEILAAMHHEFIPGHGLRMTGKHHEIYLGDPRKVAPEKLRTILRQPVEPL
ncbi:GyrI-like domain-containing protein [Glutamicibacter sp.]|uniref:GyrI-like domain-containing protein n=1 Tax=Glutamicibacter sp. TaxID=1931995 RepID=UPI003D6B73D8